jgi:NAD(P)H-hydrate repair Nnr-like enzyme with NAD(P)H-hydrate epimerase domain
LVVSAISVEAQLPVGSFQISVDLDGVRTYSPAIPYNADPVQLRASLQAGVDALFGAGLNRPLDSAVVRRLEALTANPRQVVAIDIPSGLSGDTGRPVGPSALSAVLTVTLRVRLQLQWCQS